ncbi:MAG TPA: DUF2442 domain-containing protein [Burkholderiaceae bacterium]|nr:DUF2442 domain-containing protein [Burkholderiaceae bacterium]
MWFPRLLNATPQQREQVELSPFGLHWAALDEDIAVAGQPTGHDPPRDHRDAGPRRLRGRAERAGRGR